MAVDMDERFRRADFTAGSDHKERLYQTLFHPQFGVELTDEDLDKVAGGVSVPETDKNLST